MSRYSVFAAIFAVALLVVLGLTGLLSGHGNPLVVVPAAAATPGNARCKPCVKPDGTESGKPNAVPNVTDISLDKTEVRQPCPGGEASSAGDSRVELDVTAEDADGDVLTYNYVISGGRVVGQGKKVFWDLTKVRAGTYTVTAGVDDGCGICGRTETKTVTVQECSSSE